MEEFCTGMQPSYCSQLEPESPASCIATAGQLKDADEGANKPEFWLPFLPDLRVTGKNSKAAVTTVCQSPGPLTGYLFILPKPLVLPKLGHHQ